MSSSPASRAIAHLIALLVPTLALSTSFGLSAGQTLAAYIALMWICEPSDPEKRR